MQCERMRGTMASNCHSSFVKTRLNSCLTYQHRDRCDGEVRVRMNIRLQHLLPVVLQESPAQASRQRDVECKDCPHTESLPAPRMTDVCCGRGPRSEGRPKQKGQTRTRPGRQQPSGDPLGNPRGVAATSPRASPSPRIPIVEKIEFFMIRQKDEFDSEQHTRLRPVQGRCKLLKIIGPCSLRKRKFRRAPGQSFLCSCWSDLVFDF